MNRKRCEGGFVTLIELLVVAALIIVVLYIIYGQGGGVSSVAPGGEVGVGGEGRTPLGASIARAKAVECQQNLRGLRQAIMTYRLTNESPPASLDELRVGVSSCPVSGNPYVYDPQTGTVHCTTPGHEDF